MAPQVESAFLSERELAIGHLERGSVITKYYVKKKPEKRMLAVRRETMLVVWYKAIHSRNMFEGAVDIREIKEIRKTKSSREFDRWLSSTLPDAKSSSDKLFVIYYGSEFNLKTLSVMALSESECDLWLKGLQYLMEDVKNASYKLHQERWFRKGFYEMESWSGKDGTIGLAELKKFCSKINCKVSNSVLREKFADCDTHNTGEIGFDDFCSILQKLLLGNKSLYLETFHKYCADGKRVSLGEFTDFLKSEQQETIESSAAAERMRVFLQDPARDVEEPYFTLSEFLDWLFSKENQLFDLASHEKVSQDMNRPLCHYWISSSHNTYLTGDQIQSESSCEAYARSLRMGCRSVELDCWDGPDNSTGGPLIYHGHTLTSKIKFRDVIETIKEHAFVASEYPLILSIEDHCSLAQQRTMAIQFQEVFGDMLVSAPLDKNESTLPSPAMLKRKILLKHKKLPDGADEMITNVNDQHHRQDFDIASSVKNGILYVRDNEYFEWKPHFFVLTESTMFYSEACTDEHDNEDESEDEQSSTFMRPTPKTSITSGGGASSPSMKSETDLSELHFSEPWFHRIVQNGRSMAVDLIKKHAHLGDGTFLVRPSETFVGAYSLSFLRKGEVHHVPIKDRKLEHGSVRYYLIDQVYFDSLYSLITHYQTHPLRSAKFNILLGRPVPPQNLHEGKPWFHPSLNRQTAEEMLSKISLDGAFLVRPGERVSSSFAITFRAEKKIKHCLIKQEGRLFVIGMAQFESLVDLVNYYEKHPLYRKVCLKMAVNEEVLSKNPTDSRTITADHEAYIPEHGYTDPTASHIRARALYDYSPQRDDELTLVKNCIITNIIKKDVLWWKGDYGPRKQHWFPANYVTEIEPAPPNSNPPTNSESATNADADLMPLGDLQKGSIDIMGAKVEIRDNPDRPFGMSGLEWIIRIETSRSRTPFEVAAASQSDALEWAAKIRDTSRSASFREENNRKKERALRIARELSNLVVYCRSVVFNQDRNAKREQRIHYEMSSFPETKAEKLMLSTVENMQMFLWYHEIQLSRVYPKAQRVGSDNYNPVPMWNVGSQMTALNFQTGDKPMQLNQAKFMQNGACGYILRPEYMFNSKYLPTEHVTLPPSLTMIIGVQVMAARYLSRKSGRGILFSPYVEVEICGADYDNAKFKTKTVNDNGFNPVWNDTFDFQIFNPDLALLRFVIYDVDIFGDSNFIGQYTVPVRCIRSGYRSIPLKNVYSEDLELAALLVRLQVTEKSPKVSEEPGAAALMAVVEDQKDVMEAF